MRTRRKIVRAVNHILKGMNDIDELSGNKLEALVRNGIWFFIRDKDE